MIEVRELSKVYGSGPLAFHALKSVSMTASSGEVLLLVGPSGSGKTTLLSILGCVLSPSSGSVRLAGHELAGLAESRLPEVFPGVGGGGAPARVLHVRRPGHVGGSRGQGAEDAHAEEAEEGDG